MSGYIPSRFSIIVIGLILTCVEVGCAAMIAHYCRGYLRPLIINVLAVVLTVWFANYWTDATIRQWNRGSDPNYHDAGVQSGALMSSRLSLAFFIIAEAYMMAFHGTVNPFFPPS